MNDVGDPLPVTCNASPLFSTSTTTLSGARPSIVPPTVKLVTQMTVTSVTVAVAVPVPMVTVHGCDTGATLTLAPLLRAFSPLAVSFTLKLPEPLGCRLNLTVPASFLPTVRSSVPEAL